MSETNGQPPAPLPHETVLEHVCHMPLLPSVPVGDVARRLHACAIPPLAPWEEWQDVVSRALTDWLPLTQEVP